MSLTTKIEGFIILFQKSFVNITADGIPSGGIRCYYHVASDVIRQPSTSYFSFDFEGYEDYRMFYSSFEMTKEEEY